MVFVAIKPHVHLHANQVTLQLGEEEQNAERTRKLENGSGKINWAVVKLVLLKLQWVMTQQWPLHAKLMLVSIHAIYTIKNQSTIEIGHKSLTWRPEIHRSFDQSELVRDFQNFGGPGPVRYSKIFLGPGQVQFFEIYLNPGLVLEFKSIVLRAGPRFLQFFQTGPRFLIFLDLVRGSLLRTDPARMKNG